MSHYIFSYLSWMWNH